MRFWKYIVRSKGAMIGAWHPVPPMYGCFSDDRLMAASCAGHDVNCVAAVRPSLWTPALMLVPIATYR